VKTYLQRYLIPMVALLTMLIRSNSDDPYHIPIPDYLEKLVDNLDLSVASSTSWQIQPRLSKPPFGLGECLTILQVIVASVAVTMEYGTTCAGR
jgi:hypothetical protein